MKGIAIIGQSYLRMFYRNNTILLWIILLAAVVPSATAQEATPELTVEAVPSVMPTATLGGVALHFVSGVATYQNRQPDHSGITVQVLDDALNLIGVAQTDSQGVYAVAAPVDAFYWLVLDAPLHRQQTIPMQSGESVPDATLAGGDFNGDDCIGPSDLAALVAVLDVPDSSATDVTGDGITDVSDLAIVTGNYQPDCEPEATETPAPEATPEIELTAEATPELAPEIEVTAELTPEITPEATAELTPEVETTPEVEATEEVIPELTPEVEVTAEITPQVTSEVMPDSTLPIELTEEATPEVTAEVTAEVTNEPPTPTLAPTPTGTLVPTQTPLPTQIPTRTPQPTWTFTPTETPTETPTGTA